MPSPHQGPHQGAPITPTSRAALTDDVARPPRTRTPRDQSAIAWRPVAVPVAPGDAHAVRLAEVLSALSHALDLTEGLPNGHALRSCAMAMRAAEEMGLGADDRLALYYAVLLKDAGCSSNAARLSALFGADDRAVKARLKRVDWHRRWPLALATLGAAGEDGPLARLRHFLGIARAGAVTRQLIAIRCERGAGVARALGFPEVTASAIASLDEHWNGQGHPQGLRGEEIPLLARIANLAQVMDVFLASGGAEAAVRVAEERSGSWFDPQLVQLVRAWRGDARWWRRLRASDTQATVAESEPSRAPLAVTEVGLDAIAAAFAEIIDAKSPYTFSHSANVATYAEGVGRAMGLPAEECRLLRRAGLLHDFGKLGVSSRVLDKPGALNAVERAEILRHPVYTWEILSRVSAFQPFAWTAALHHEKLDGSGYPWGIRGDRLSLPARILTVADVYEALVADRPYRGGLGRDKALDVLRQQAGTQLCVRSVAGLEAFVRGDGR